MTRAGIVAVVGVPNVGKSTLLNRVIGQKLSITSPKPQSTRTSVIGIRTEGDTQIAFVDTPGLLEPAYELQRAMRAAAIHALRGADVIVHLVDATEGEPADLPVATNAPRLIVFNKIDLLDKTKLDGLREKYPDAFLISAADGRGVDALVAEIEKRLPESPFLYPEDEISTQSMRFFVSELIRETALEQLHNEVPYSVAAEVEEFREERRPVYIRATIFVERDSQKGILIGHKGARIREIGTSARAKIERLVGADVFLDLHVKVLPNWRRDADSLRRFGLTVTS
jgi:GTP-binding protein Era